MSISARSSDVIPFRSSFLPLLSLEFDLFLSMRSRLSLLSAFGPIVCAWSCWLNCNWLCLIFWEPLEDFFWPILGEMGFDWRESLCARTPLLYFLPTSCCFGFYTRFWERRLMDCFFAIDDCSLSFLWSDPISVFRFCSDDKSLTRLSCMWLSYSLSLCTFEFYRLICLMRSSLVLYLSALSP